MEQKNFKRTTVTAALPYANGGVHIGHLAGVYVPADIYVRYLRLKKQDVVFIGGSDEHGVPVTIRAKKEGITVQEVVDRYHNLIKKSFEDFGISFDIYSRTTSPTHNKFASDTLSHLLGSLHRQHYGLRTMHHITTCKYARRVVIPKGRSTTFTYPFSSTSIPAVVETMRLAAFIASTTV